MKIQAENRKDVIAFGEVLWDVIDGVPYIGGAPFNFAAHAARLGLGTALVSAVGDDELGARTRAEILRLGVDDACVATDAAHETGTVLVTLTDGIPSYEIKRPVAWDAIPVPEPQPACPRAFYYGTLAARNEVSAATLRQLLAAYGDALTFYDVNLRQSFWSVAFVRELVSSAKILKVNDEEMQTLGFSPEALMADFPKLETVVMTKGAAGCEVFCRGRAPFSSPAVPDGKVVDTVGAGDSFSAAFLAALLRGETVEAAAHAGNVLGGRVAARPGAIPDGLNGV